MSTSRIRGALQTPPCGAVDTDRASQAPLAGSQINSQQHGHVLVYVVMLSSRSALIFPSIVRLVRRLRNVLRCGNIPRARDAWYSTKHSFHRPALVGHDGAMLAVLENINILGRKH